jgi:hypothetical protein
MQDESQLPYEQQGLIYRLRNRAKIRRSIKTRKSVQLGQPDKIANLLEEAADTLERIKYTLIKE